MAFLTEMNVFKILLACVLLGATHRQVWAQTSASPTLQKSEIALEGIVRAFNPKAHLLRLEASRFGLPNGRSGPIQPPKIKLVQFPAKGISPATLRQIRVGSALRVWGVDGGAGKPLRARAFGLATISPPAEPTAQTAIPIPDVAVSPWPAPDIREAAPPAPPEKPMTGTHNGWTFALEDAVISTSPNDPKPSLRAKFVVQGPDNVILAPDWKDVQNFKLRLLSPLDLPVEAHPNNYGRTLSSADAARFPWVWAEFSGRNPRAPDGLSIHEANGMWNPSLDLEIPAPVPDQTVRLDKTLVSPQGSIVKIDELTLKKQGEGGQISVRVTTSSPPGQPGLAVKSLDGQVIDEKGRSISGSSGGGSEPGLYRIDFAKMPTGAQWKLRFNLTEIDRARAVGSERFRVRFKIPIETLPRRVEANLKDTRSDLETPVGVSIAKNGEVEAQIETLRAPFESLVVAQLSLRDLSADKTVVWDYKDSQAWDENGVAMKRSLSQDQLRPLRWRFDGTLAPPKTMERAMQFHFDPQTRPTKLRVRVELESRRALDYNWTISTALPAPGQTLTLDEDVTAENGAPFVLRSVRAFSSLDELTGLVYKPKIAPSGVALTFEAKPFIPGAFFNMHFARAHDQLGRPLDSYYPFGALWVSGNAFGPRAASNFYTLLLATPPADSKTVEIQARTTEVGPTLGKTSLEFTDLTVPTVPPRRAR